MNNIENISPVFLCGPLRSGSTVLHVMLSQNPRIASLGEYDFLFDMVNDQGEIPTNKEYIEWLSLNRIFQSKELEVDHRLTYLEQVQSFLRQKSSPDKQLVFNIHRNFHRIPFLFPEAKYIHLIRDPRDVARSCIGMGWVGNVYYGVDHWIEVESSWDKLQSIINNTSFKEVYFEQLINEPEDNLANLCAFMNVPYSPEMLAYEGRSTYSKPDPKLTSQWKRKLSKREIQNAEAKVSQMIVKRGYELSSYPSRHPNIVELIWLSLQNKLYKIKFRIKRYGFNLYLSELLSRHLDMHKWHKTCSLKINDIDKNNLK
jgi:hypothetical protein